mmetsp:Transcript_21266/g.32712  ORF Transcript_21266/g.32712 Transcript_21266/m.32712 type:complete len:199 (+) Transcript_21266:190-786(+)|eukprot:CAMPEP_0195295050 /NCGR_PEP_ID=MMETSP0707-20130614/16479_1 /TAXON_ID=33640 /ORGANISM="Asterionellopsis glacialis, Strain CCMP134" /LENGTH=198 /DNA_ID=CAMNT_0040356183 /DNA_START=125 /DNA_END=721 /DNA_ORIENTATION=-
MSTEKVAKAECFKKNWSSRKMRLWLNHLARSFREQSALYLQQADLLDRMALACDKGDEYNPELLESSSSTDPLEQQQMRRNIISYASESTSLMLKTHKRLDDIESRLDPWVSNAKTKKKPEKKRKRVGTPYNLYTQMHWDFIASKVGSRHPHLVLREGAKRWKELSDAEKKIYYGLFEAKKEEFEKQKEANKQSPVAI